MEKRTKTLVIILVVLAAAAGAYYLYSYAMVKKPAPPNPKVIAEAPIPKFAGAAAPAAKPVSPAPAANPAPPAPGPKKSEPAKTAAVAAPAPAPAPATQAAKAAETPDKAFIYSSLGKRDPFMSPLEVPKVYPPVPPNAKPIERVPTESLAVEAIVWNWKGFRAMVVTPDGRGYTVKVGDSIGNKGGRIVKISEKRLYVTEHILDILGNVEAKNIVLKLHKEAD